MHGIPTVAVDVCAKGAVTGNAFVKVITDFAFTQIEKLVLPAGTYDLAVVAKGTACTSPIAGLSATGLAVPAGANISIIANLTAAEAPTLTVGVNDISKLDKGEARVTAYHAAAAPKVNICAAARDTSNKAIAAYGSFGAVFSGVMNGQSGSTVVDANAYKIAIAADGCTPVKTLRANLKQNANTIFYAVGSLTGGTFTVLSQTIKIDRKGDREHWGSDPKPRGDDDDDDDDDDDRSRSRGERGQNDDRSTSRGERGRRSDR